MRLPLIFSLCCAIGLAGCGGLVPPAPPGHIASARTQTLPLENYIYNSPRASGPPYSSSLRIPVAPSASPNALQYIPGDSFLTSVTPFVPTGGTSGRTPADIAADVVNVRSFATPACAATDWAPCFNAALAKIRSDALANGGISYESLYIPAGQYTTLTPINLTCFGGTSGSSISGCTAGMQNLRFVVISAGATILCNVNGGICLDAQGSEDVQIVSGALNIVGGCTFGTNEPTVGLALGEIAFQNGLINNQISHVNTNNGCFSVAAFYSRRNEQTGLSDDLFVNLDTSRGYACAFDATNHLNVTSSFLTVTYPVDAANRSFSHVTLVHADCEGGNGAMFISGSPLGFTMLGSFLHPTTGYAIQFWSATNLDNIQLFKAIGFHAENANPPWSEIGFTSNVASTTYDLEDFRINDGGVQATQSVFARDSNTTLVRFRRQSEISLVEQNAISPTLLDNAANFAFEDWRAVSIRNVSGAISGWSLSPGSCTGLGSGGTCIINGSNPTETVASGIIELTAGSSGAGSSGNVVITFPALAIADPTCVFTLGGFANQFAAGATVFRTGHTQNTLTVNWQNAGVNLTAGGTYGINYSCGAF